MNFNSIKVRLELQALALEYPKLLTFQFHKGAIRTMQRYVTTLLESNFNSIKVRLERKNESKQGREDQISIP